MTEDTGELHDLVARTTYARGKWPLLVDVRCPVLYRGRSCGKQMARVLSTPRGALFVMVVDGGKVLGVDGDVPPMTVLDLLEFKPERPWTEELFGRCRRHVGTVLGRDELLSAVHQARRLGKVVVFTPAETWS